MGQKAPARTAGAHEPERWPVWRRTYSPGWPNGLCRGLDRRIARHGDQYAVLVRGRDGLRIRAHGCHGRIVPTGRDLTRRKPTAGKQHYRSYLNSCENRPILWVIILFIASRGCGKVSKRTTCSPFPPSGNKRGGEVSACGPQRSAAPLRAMLPTLFLARIMLNAGCRFFRHFLPPLTPRVREDKGFPL